VNISPSLIALNNIYSEYLKIIIILGTLGVLIGIALHYLLIGPNAKKLGQLKPDLKRLTLLERVTHFIRMISCIFLTITGLGFAILNFNSIGISYKPVYNIHILFAMLFGLSSLVSLIIWFKDSFFQRYDWQWFKVMGGYLTRKEIHPPSGKFNAGQKAFYWYSTLLSILIITSGYILVYNESFSLEALIWATIIHGLGSIALIAGVIAHAYLGSFANPGTIGTIFHGKVAKEWAKSHHPNWYQELR